MFLFLIKLNSVISFAIPEQSLLLDSDYYLYLKLKQNLSMPCFIQMVCKTCISFNYSRLLIFLFNRMNIFAIFPPFNIVFIVIKHMYVTCLRLQCMTHPLQNTYRVLTCITKLNIDIVIAF